MSSVVLCTPHGGDVCSMQGVPQWRLWAPYGDPLQCCMCFYRDPNYLQPILGPWGFLPQDNSGSTCNIAVDPHMAPIVSTVEPLVLNRHHYREVCRVSYPIHETVYLLPSQWHAIVNGRGVVLHLLSFQIHATVNRGIALHLFPYQMHAECANISFCSQWQPSNCYNLWQQRHLNPVSVFIQLDKIYFCTRILQRKLFRYGISSWWVWYIYHIILFRVSKQECVSVSIYKCP